MLHPFPPVQEFFWDDILEFIEERRVIPIVGSELLGAPDARAAKSPCSAC
jgi:hypothetical protein